MASAAPLDAGSAANVAGASSVLDAQQAARNNRRLVLSIAMVFAFNGLTMSINGIGSPWIAKSFDLGESGIASLFAWISFSAVFALALSRVLGRLRHRRMLLPFFARPSPTALPPPPSTPLPTLPPPPPP